MKKLIALLALVAMVSGAEAATTIKLTAYNNSSWDDRIRRGIKSNDYLYTGTMYLVFGRDQTVRDFRNQLIAAYEKGPVDFDSFITKWEEAGNTITVEKIDVNDNGRYWIGTRTFNINHTVERMVAFAEMQDVYGAANPSDYYLAAVQLNLSQQKEQDWHASAFTNKENFTFGGPSAVPEPTSGLLLLLGVAGLALRRKRA